MLNLWLMDGWIDGWMDWLIDWLILLSIADMSGYRSGSPTAVRPSNPALCGSCPLVTPYYYRLGVLLCYTCMLYLSTILCVYAYLYFVFSLFSGLFSFVDFPSVLWYCLLGLLTCKNRLPYNLYYVGGDVKTLLNPVQADMLFVWWLCEGSKTSQTLWKQVCPGSSDVLWLWAVAKHSAAGCQGRTTGR